MKNLFVIGFIVLLSACSNTCNECAYEQPRQIRTYHQPSYDDCGMHRVKPQNQVPCCQQEVIREPARKVVYKTVYETQNYDSAACERKPYKTRDCSAVVYNDYVVKPSQVVVFEQKTVNVNKCTSCCCQPPAQRKLTCNCTLQ